MALTICWTHSWFSVTDCRAGPRCQTCSRSIFDQIKDWKAYEEGMGTRCRKTDDYATHYVVRHNPPPYYTRIAEACRKRDVPLHSSTVDLAHDLKTNTLPRFAFITPNTIHDEHDGTIAQGDDWLRYWAGHIT